TLGRRDLVGLAGADRHAKASSVFGNRDQPTVPSPSQLPATFVYFHVVAMAQDDGVVEAGLAAERPMHDAMACRPRCRPVASRRPPTVLLAGVERAPHRA